MLVFLRLSVNLAMIQFLKQCNKGWENKFLIYSNVFRGNISFPNRVLQEGAPKKHMQMCQARDKVFSVNCTYYLEELSTVYKRKWIAFSLKI